MSALNSNEMPSKLRWLALLWLVLGVALNPWIVEWWSGREPLPRAMIPLLVLSVGLLSLAATTWFWHARSVVPKLNLLALSSLLVAPLAVEIGLRLSFRLPGSPTRAPLRFGHNLIHDDYWILAGRWDTYSDKIVPARVHADLGWSQTYPSDDSPLGLGDRVLRQLRKDGRPKVLFYGDSYVGGHSRPENYIPTYLDDRLPLTDVVHLGVGGYGTGQSYLLFEQTSSLVERPLVIMSAMVYDLDRSTLTVRSYQKPRLRVGESGLLEVTNTPIDPDPERFFDDAELSFSSFALKALERWCLPLVDPLFPEKLELNRAILAATAARARNENAELLYVLFHPIAELVEEDYRSEFFIEALAEAGIECLDTRGPLLEHIKATGIDPGELYVTGHHNDLGNQVVANAILDELRKRGLN